jgi:hypothetical protein
MEFVSMDVLVLVTQLDIPILIGVAASIHDAR